ncbi:cysteine-rich CWC family protein [Paenibacillus humicola]|uniref:cysteine-rich CWC family protein n=1 Tax=Paenibacillus humicola TaxID=3110540 RepID=UPI00237AD632|nr:cysteine-rich CWC family protein [Paenibacillus humicola]
MANDPARCPLCGGDNSCVMAAGRKDEPCWCMTARFPEEIFALIPPENRRKACICPACLERFKHGHNEQQSTKPKSIEP